MKVSYIVEVDYMNGTKTPYKENVYDKANAIFEDCKTNPIVKNVSLIKIRTTTKRDVIQSHQRTKTT